MRIKKAKRAVYMDKESAKVAKTALDGFDLAGQLGAPFAKGSDRVLVARLFHALRGRAEKEKAPPA